MLIFKYIVLYHGIYHVLGTVIDSQNLESSTVQVHCLSTDTPIQIKDPFSNSLIHDEKFIAMEWYQLLPAGPGREAKETQLLQFLPNKTRTALAKFSIYDFWGLQINDVGLEDSAIYKAKLVHLSQEREWSFELVVATPPVMKSEQLSVSKTVRTDDQSVNYSCGRIASLGSPPVNFVWKTEMGKVLPAVYQDGYLSMILTSEEDTGKYTCELDTSSLAARCIIENDVPRFKGVLVQTSKYQSADMTGVIAGVVAAVLITAAIIVIVICIMRRRKIKSEIYNARKHEEKRDIELGKDNATSRAQNEKNPLDNSHDPIYKGPNSSDAFMVSKVSEGNTALIFKRMKPQMDSTNMVYLNGERSPAQISGNQAEETDKQESQWNQEKLGEKYEKSQVPHIKPRKVVLTSSMEELDKISRNVNGGTSTMNRGTLV